ncbi:hypothetical protein [Ruegeria arenilitoris]|uniref:hypothetical protein n=1 Tax=Ruegeria arenilitoris TaxID=1173585 RepID=UPI00147DE0F8|nr:hypothetical protein [Ruegeria arenilitoris]
MRDDTLYPIEGFNLKVVTSLNFTLEGITGDYSEAFVNFTKYFNPVPKGVIAARAST